jgi:hypothetical protein
MHRILPVILLLLLSMQNVMADTFLPFQGPRPLAVLIDTDPWRMVIGSDTPSFVLYEDGQVIYRNRTEKKKLQYLSKLLTPDELRSLKAKLASFGPYRKGRSQIDLADVSDQPETKLFLKFDDTELAANIYGMSFVDMPRSEGRSKTPLPAELRKLYAYLLSLEFKDSKEWEPKFFEAMAWDYGYAPDPSISWPKQWPGLTSPTTIKKTDMYSIYLPGAELKNVSAFLATRKEKGAVEIDGKKFAVSIRPTFPSEPVWRKAFSQSLKAGD